MCNIYEVEAKLVRPHCNLRRRRVASKLRLKSCTRRVSFYFTSNKSTARGDARTANAEVRTVCGSSLRPRGASGLPAGFADKRLGRRRGGVGFLSHLRSVRATMSQKFSDPQAVSFVSQALKRDSADRLHVLAPPKSWESQQLPLSAVAGPQDPIRSGAVPVRPVRSHACRHGVARVAPSRLPGTHTVRATYPCGLFR
jgi:hypothetical protein